MIKLKSIVLFCVSFIYLPAIAQKEEITVEKNNQLQLDVGYMVLFNNANKNHYYDFKSNMSTDLTGIHGLNLKFTIPTKREYLDVIVGTMILGMIDNVGSSSWSPGNTNSSDYTQNGGGVYFGVSPKLKGKVIGLTSDFAIGIFSFKEYVGIFNNTQPPYIDTYDRMASHGLGAMSSIGFYVKVGAFGINPSMNAVYSGGAQTSFLFYGFNFPLTIRLGK